MFLLLVGPPGIGKTDPIREVFTFSESLPTFHLAPSNVSSASLIDAISKATRVIQNPPPAKPLIFNSLLAAADELGVFLQKYDAAFMSGLNKLFDGTPYHESKRGMKDDIKIASPLLSLIAGTTPGWLGSGLPDSAWSEGFASRLIMIYSAERIRVNPFGTQDESSDVLRAELTADLKHIHGLSGQFLYDDDVRDAYLSWHETDLAPVPEHPRLEHYIPRRNIHFWKLAMAWSAARSDELIIRMEDYQNAMDMFLEAESHMPDVFRAIKSTASDGAVIDECFAFAYQIFHKEGKGVARQRIISFLAQRVPSHNVQRVLEIMVASGYLIPDGANAYKPVPKLQRL